MTKFITGRIRAGGYALRGAVYLLKNEASIQAQFVIAILVTIAGFYFDITHQEWIYQILAIGLIMTAEGLNTAIEKMADFVHPDFHSKIGYIKDVAAGAVFIAAITAVVIGVIIYYPYVFP